MSNVAMGLDDKQTPETCKDEDGDGSHSGGDLGSMDATQVGPGDVPFTNVHVHSSSMQDAQVEHGEEFPRAQLDDLSTITAVAAVHGDANAEMGRRLGRDSSSPPSSSSPSSPFSSEMCVQNSAESMPNHAASYKHATLASLGMLDENRCESVSSHPASGKHVDLSDDGTPVTPFSESTVPSNVSKDQADGTASHESHLGELPRASSASSRNARSDASMYGTSEKHALKGSAAPDHIPQGDWSEWSAHQIDVADPELCMPSDMCAGNPSYEALPANDSIGTCTQERSSLDLPVLKPAATTGHILVGINEEPVQFTCRDTFENDDIRGNLFNYRVLPEAVGTYRLQHSPLYNQPGGEDFKVNAAPMVTSSECLSLTQNSFAYDQHGGEELKVNAGHMETSSEAPSFTANNGLFFSRSSYFTSQSGRMKNFALLLRLGGAVFSLVAFSVIISTSEKRVAAGSTFYVKFSDFQAYNYVAALNLLTFLYSSGQMILLAHAKTTRVLSSPLKWGTSVYVCDQMLALLMVSSSSSAATASELSRNGLHNVWPPACSTWKLSLFCCRADVAVAVSFGSCLFVVLSTFSSGYHLSNLLAE